MINLVTCRFLSEWVPICLPSLANYFHVLWNLEKVQRTQERETVYLQGKSGAFLKCVGCSRRAPLFLWRWTVSISSKESVEIGQFGNWQKVIAHKSASSMQTIQTIGACGYLLVAKAVTEKFLVQHHLYLWFHPSDSQQPLSKWLVTYFSSNPWLARRLLTNL